MLGPGVQHAQRGICEDALCGGLFKRLGRRAGIEKRTHPLALRDTVPVRRAPEGYFMSLIQQQHGHSPVLTTSRYLDHVVSARLRAILYG